MDRRLPRSVRDLAATLDQWETAGPTFARSRPRPWPQVVRWADEHLAPGARVLDLAAGNGRHGAALQGRNVVASDFAAALLSEARARGLACVRAEAGETPFRAASFDGVLFIAALHNVPGRQRRLAALAEVARVLKPGGKALVTVWSRWRAGWLRHFAMELPHHVWGDEHGAFGDAIVPWTAGTITVPRYYHFYSRPELRADLALAGLRVDAVWGERLAVPRSAKAPASWLADNLFASVTRPE